MQSPKVLIIDDEKNIRTVMETELPTFGFVVSSAATGQEGQDRLKEDEFDVVLLDLNLPGMGGIEVLRQMRAGDLPVEVIVLTADAAIPTAVEAVKLGAYDYLVKPVDLEHLSNIIGQATDKKRLRTENIVLKTTLKREEHRDELIAESPAMRACLGVVEKVAGTDFTVLITGESGCGKEVTARTLHRLSVRSEGPFIALNCGAIPETMIESELFGYERGAFTGAQGRKLGLLELASSGTLFLDEIGDMPLALQVKLLRVIETGSFYRLGGTRELKVDLRIISATNKDLSGAIEKGTFRSDLFYRIAGFTLAIPPLRERKEDIPLFIDQVVTGNPLFRGRRFSPEALSLLLNYGWPGNVRELQNVLQRVLLLSPGPEILARDLPADLSSGLTQTSGLLSDMEREHILKTLNRTGRHVERTAEILGIHAKTLRRKLAEYGVEP